MICPYCSHENPEGRKYCQTCAKPLAPQTVFERPAPPPTLQAGLRKPPLSKMALASLILSFFSLIVPFGIAALVLGHMSRNRIAKSGGRLRGGWFAFAGLILGYIQAPVGALLFLGGIGFLYQFNQELSKHRGVRGALVERIENGDPYKVTTTDEAKHQQTALDALRMIRARQDEYLRAHPDEGYACSLNQLGYELNPQSELGALVINSRYEVNIRQCKAANEVRYVVLAVPNSNFNLPDSPEFCMDSTGVIYKYRSDQVNDVTGRVVMAAHPELCPQYGERAAP
jgi:Domain of unknown function (DUF4190)